LQRLSRNHAADAALFDPSTTVVPAAFRDAWDMLASMSPDEIRQRGLLPAGFTPLPHIKQATGGQVLPNNQIDEIRTQEGRNLRRFDVDFDLPDIFTPEFPPPFFLSSHPELGDVSRGRLLTIKNYYELMVGIIKPVQMEGLRLLLTPFPQEEFNQTEDRKVEDQSLGISCFDCHSKEPLQKPAAMIVYNVWRGGLVRMGWGDEAVDAGDRGI
jgi:cytochrome c peroxidase